MIVKFSIHGGLVIDEFVNVWRLINRVMDEASTSKDDGNRARKEAEEREQCSSLSWSPTWKGAFNRYSPSVGAPQKSSTLGAVVKRPLVARLTRDIVETYQICNPEFRYSEDLNPKRYLTSPSVGVLNDGYDNANSDLILTVNFVLVNVDSQRRYIVKDVLGHGTFGQVAKCWVPDTNSYVAVKIIKNQPAYYQQALVEVSILTTLNKKFDPGDKSHIVRILDYFVYQRHLCISFELLGANLYEVIKINQFRGLSLNIVQLLSKQILHALVLMRDAGVIHCDLKPENILLCTSLKPAEIKIIDFGSACMEDRTVYSYIQSRYYRSPEVLLGYQYTTAIDMWSFGCIVAELFLGLPLFPGASEFDLLRRMIEILGYILLYSVCRGQPPDNVLKEAKNTNKFFKRVGSIYHFENIETTMSGESAYQALTEKEYEARELKKPLIGKEYFNHMKLEEIVTSYPYRRNLPQEEISKESLTRLALIDFLRGLVEFDPAKRWSPLQASRHPFITGELFTCSYKPPQETPRMSVAQNVNVDHHPGGGHWFAAGLSPQVTSTNRGPLQSSQHFQVTSYSHASSYGSLGSHGSYNDNAGFGSSYGSYGDNRSMYAYYSPVGPSSMSIHAQGGVPILGASPDTRRRTSQISHGNGLGVSSSAGNFVPMSLGASPSQFTPPSSHIQVSAGSPKYSPSSPVRSSGFHGSPLSKMTAVSQFNRRRSWGYPGSSQSQESASSPHSQGYHTDGANYSHTDRNSRGHGNSPQCVQSSFNPPNWRQQRGCNGVNSGNSSTIQNVQGSLLQSSNIPFQPAKEAAFDKSENNMSLPDPGDWDPNYSDELLLQEDGSDLSSVTSEFSNGLHLCHASDSAVPMTGVGRFSHNPNQAQTSSSLSIQRTNGPVRSYSHVEMGSPLSAHDMYAGYPRALSKPSHLMSHFSLNHPSRLGQQPAQRLNPGHSTFAHGTEWGHPKVQAPLPNCNTGTSNSPSNSTFTDGMNWGRRALHPITTIPPLSYARKEYGRIT
ncbi:PREDICTED: probable serine/threonine-protein kinase yakA isoform X2 [Nelumbo nucifera]|uniref:Probable serine/threonine-protein kinase yakA isoform X2 n=1 Tax=Nelumbo nucifera TaxID=4432 RepID=A0A1U8Q734_NELNU|nr:PREDICTED: probable serine/threonine-protein kinase yakA isoform X2 [Nelumbo nucifera]